MKAAAILTALLLLATAEFSKAQQAQPGAPAKALPSVTTTDTGIVIAEEETSAIERALENRVREVLSGIVSPDKFAVYVQVRIKPDAKTIQQYYDERAITSVPGIVLSDTTDNSPANNKLYSLVDTKKIMVVFDRGVTAEQELVAKEILTSKLALDTEKGDKIEFRRAAVPTAIDRQIDLEKGKPQAPSWVKWVLILIGAALLASVAILLWQISLLRERVNSRAKLSAALKVDREEEVASKAPKPGNGTENDEQDAGTDKAPDKTKSALSTYELKERILALLVANPKACSIVARRLFADETGLQKLAITCETVGFEYCKQLFENISPAKWRKVGDYIKANIATLAKTAPETMLQDVYADMLAETLGWDPHQNTKGPFDFLHKLSQPELQKLFNGEEPNNIALIAAFWEPTEMTQILDVLPEDPKKAVILQMSRLQTLPREIIEQAGFKFANRMKAIRDKNETDINGSEVVARILDTVDSSLEESLLSFLEKEDPETRERLRAYYFSFDSLPLISDDVLVQILETTETEDITAALFGAPEAVRKATLNLLPPKKQAIVEDDIRLAYAQKTISPVKTSAARKKIVNKAKKALAERGISLVQLLADARKRAEEAAQQPSAPGLTNDGYVGMDPKISTLDNQSMSGTEMSINDQASTDDKKAA